MNQNVNTVPSTVGLVADDEMMRLLSWPGELIQQNGPGEYIVNVARGGHVTVKRPRKPLEFHYGG